jgi:hypothetical protein
MRIPLTPEFTALVTGHGKTKSYLHRFKLAEDPTCPCNQGPQTPDHIIYDCDIIEAQRRYLISKYLKVFIIFVQLIDFEKLK